MAKPKSKTAKPGLTEKKEEKQKVPLNSTAGVSGTIIAEGIISEEYNRDLEGLKGSEVYETMRKSDAQCSAVLTVCELPLRSAEWSIVPANKDGISSPQDIEIAKFIKQNLFGNELQQSFDGILVEVFTMLTFGFSVFEKSWKIEDGMVWLRKFESRRQNTVKQWTTGGGIIQLFPKNDLEPGKQGDEKSIPPEKTTIFSHRREGLNYEGVSMLRPAYKHWFIKDQLYKFDGVRHERQSVGIPQMNIPSGASDEDKKEAQIIVNNVRANEQIGIVIPGGKDEGWEFNFANMQAGGSDTSIMSSVDHHNREITKTMLAQFLELGNTSSGSRALGESFNDMFLMSCESIGKNICETFNRDVIKQLVDLNFDDVEKYPEIEVEKIRGIDWKEISTGLNLLGVAGLLSKTPETEAHIRKMFSLPNLTEEQAKDITENAKIDQAEARLKNAKKDPIPAPKDTPKTKIKAKDPHDCGEFDADYHQLSNFFNNEFLAKLQNEVPGLDKKKT